MKRQLSNIMDPDTPTYTEDLRKIGKACIVHATENIVLKEELSHTKVAEAA